MKDHFEKSQEVPINQSNSIMKNLLQRLTESVYENQAMTIEFETKLNEIKLLDELEEKNDNGPAKDPSDLLEKYESTRFNQSYGSDLSDEQSGSQQ